MYEIYTKENLFIQKNSIFLQELHSYWHSKVYNDVPA